MTKIHSGEGVTEARLVPGWNDYFLSLARSVSQRSRDPNTQVGAVIVDANNHVISTGYNGPPPGLNDRALDWSRGADSRSGKYRWVLHAEVNAIVHARCDLRGCTLYVTGHPCHACAKVIAAAGLAKVVYLARHIASVDGEERNAAAEVLSLAGIPLLQWGEVE